MRCGNCTKCDCQLGIGFAHCKCAGIVIKKRYGLIIFSIQVWFYQIHLSLLFLLSFYNIEIRYFPKKCCLLLCNSAASVCKREKDGQQTKGRQQTANTKHSGTQKATLTRTACIVLVVIGVLISLSRCAAAACNKNNFLRERVTLKNI